MELRSIGYIEVSSISRNSSGPALRIPDPEEALAALPRPDISQMIPFKPKLNALPGEHPVPGKQKVSSEIENEILTNKEKGLNVIFKIRIIIAGNTCGPLLPFLKFCPLFPFLLIRN